MKKQNRGFDDAVQFVLKWETVFAPGHYGDYYFAITENDPDDPGGATKYGLDARSHGDVENLTLSQAIEIYRTEYWNRAKCDKWPFPIAMFLFDSAVNVGIGQATKWFQRLSGASVDGVWGPKTDTHVAEWIDDVGVQSALELLLSTRRAFYKSLSKPKFEAGWLNRVTALQRFVGLSSPC